MPKSKSRACAPDCEPADGKLRIEWWADKILKGLVEGRGVVVPDHSAAKWGAFAAQGRYDQLKRDGKLPKRGAKR